MILRLLTGFVLLCTGFLSADSFLESGTKPEMLAEVGAGEGPAWHPELGLLTSHDGHIYQRDPSGKQSIYRENAGTNGLLFDREGRLVLCEPVQRRVTRLEKDGNLSVLTDNFLGKKYNQPNDLTIDSKGRIYFTDPRYVGDEARELDHESVYRIEIDGIVTRVIGDVTKPNGLVISPDGKTLYLSEHHPKGPRLLLAYPLKDDGTVGPRKQLVDFGTDRGIDGMTVASDGTVVATAGTGPTAGVHFFDPTGKKVGFLPTPEDPNNCCFAGPGSKTLYVTAGKSLYRVELTLAGR